MGFFNWLSRLFRPTPDYYRMRYPDVRDSSGRSHILDHPGAYVYCERCRKQILPYARCWIVSEPDNNGKRYYCTDCYPSSDAYQKIQEEAERDKKEVRAAQDRRFKEDQRLRLKEQALSGPESVWPYTPLHTVGTRLLADNTHALVVHLPNKNGSRITVRLCYLIRDNQGNESWIGESPKLSEDLQGGQCNVCRTLLHMPEWQDWRGQFRVDPVP